MGLHDLTPERTYPELREVTKRAIINLYHSYLETIEEGYVKEVYWYVNQQGKISYRIINPNGTKTENQLDDYGTDGWSRGYPQYDHIPFSWSMVELI